MNGRKNGPPAGMACGGISVDLRDHIRNLEQPHIQTPLAKGAGMAGDDIAASLVTQRQLPQSDPEPP